MSTFVRITLYCTLLFMHDSKHSCNFCPRFQNRWKFHQCNHNDRLSFDNDSVNQNLQNVSRNTDTTFTFALIIVHTYTSITRSDQSESSFAFESFILKKYDFKWRNTQQYTYYIINEFTIHTWLRVKVFRLCHVEGLAIFVFYALWTLDRKLDRNSDGMYKRWKAFTIDVGR